MLVWIKDDRDSVTQQENLLEKKKMNLRLEMVFFLPFSLKVYCACIKSWSVKSFCAQYIISYLSCHACMHHTRHQVKCLMPNSFPKVKKYGRPMGISDRCHKKHSRRIWARHPIDKRAASHIDKFVRRPHPNRDGAFPRSVTLVK